MTDGQLNDCSNYHSMPDDTSIREAPLSARAKKCLDNMGLLTFGEVRRTADFKLLRIDNFGRKSLREVRMLFPFIDPAKEPPAPLLPQESVAHVLQRLAQLERDMAKLGAAFENLKADATIPSRFERIKANERDILDLRADVFKLQQEAEIKNKNSLSARSDDITVIKQLVNQIYAQTTAMANSRPAA